MHLTNTDPTHNATLFQDRLNKRNTIIAEWLELLSLSYNREANNNNNENHNFYTKYQWFIRKLEVIWYTFPDTMRIELEGQPGYRSINYKQACEVIGTIIKILEEQNHWVTSITTQTEEAVSTITGKR